MIGMNSRKAAIDAKCKECVYDECVPNNGTWRQQTEACTSYDCPLYPFRPISRTKSISVEKINTQDGNIDDNKAGDYGC